MGMTASMDRTERGEAFGNFRICKEYHERMFPGYISKLFGTDPEGLSIRAGDVPCSESAVRQF